MTKHIALLRGINVGGRNKLPMKDLARLFQDVGCSSVKTYIQSGNVVFEAGDLTVEELPRLLAESIHRAFGLEVPVVLRSAAELRRIVESNPYLAEGTEEKALHVAFLAETPGAEAVDSLDPDRSPPDRYTVQGREIYLLCPNGLARTKLTNAYFDRGLGTTSTVRNWKTTRKLLEMAEG